MRTLQIRISPVLDNLLRRLGRTTTGEEEQFIQLGYRKAFGKQTRDFSGYRVYTPMDDASQIDWKASIRSNELLIKEYTEQRALTVFFLIDTPRQIIISGKIEFPLEFLLSVSIAIAIFLFGWFAFYIAQPKLAEKV